jgi:hypothetical protein
MLKKNDYKQILLELKNWDDFLVKQSSLPSPRANLELLHAAIEVGNEAHFVKYIKPNKNTAPVNDPMVFPLLVGVAGLGKLIAEGNPSWFDTLAFYARDERWRVREAVAIALQIVGDTNMNLLLKTMDNWKIKDFYVQRAVVAGLCEPRLLTNKLHAEEVLDILKVITRRLENYESIHDNSFKTLRQTLGYGLSVVVVSLPSEGKRFMEQLKKCKNPDIRWIVKENLKKNRLIKMDPEWIKKMISAP